MRVPQLSLSLTGATVLRNGRMQRDTVSLDAGRIVDTALPSADFGGHLLLPGIVDIHAHAPETSLDDYGKTASPQGVTTTFLAQRWTGDTAASVEAALDSLARPCADAPVEMHAHLVVDLATADTADRLLASIARHRPAAVLFADTPRHDPCKPRYICRIANTCDRHKIPYGSLADPDGETRERYAMLGARLCAFPRSRAAAALAAAVGDPVILAATDVCAPARSDAPWSAQSAVNAGHCAALASVDDAGTLHRAALHLAQLRALDLPRAWALISSRPARIMGLSDRGTLDPGRRADLVAVRAATGRIEATFQAGRPTYLTDEATRRLVAACPDTAAALVA